jgi:hypothetical protein
MLRPLGNKPEIYIRFRPLGNKPRNLHSQMLRPLGNKPEIYIRFYFNLDWHFAWLPALKGEA